MIELYTWSTPNGRKVSIMLEELGLPYNVHAINIGKDDQFTPEFVAINPNSKIPAIVDPEGPDGKPISMMESGAILIYLAEKTGSSCPRRRATATWRCNGSCSRWAAWGRCSGRCTISCARRKSRCRTRSSATPTETRRLYGVLNERLKDHEYLADEYSIADIATYPWVARYEWHKTRLEDFPRREALVRRDLRAARGAEGDERAVVERDPRHRFTPSGLA